MACGLGGTNKLTSILGFSNLTWRKLPGMDSDYLFDKMLTTYPLLPRLTWSREILGAKTIFSFFRFENSNTPFNKI